MSGSTACAKPSPIDPPMISAATMGAANATCRMRPIARPTSASAATATKVASPNTCAGGTTGCAASTRNPTAPDSVTRTINGNATAPNTGAAMNAAPIRTITKISAQSCGSIERPKPNIERYLHQVRNAREDVVGEIGQQPDDHRAEDHDRHRDHDQLGDERQGLFVDRGRRLHHADDQPRQQRRASGSAPTASASTHIAWFAMVRK